MKETKKIAANNNSQKHRESPLSIQQERCENSAQSFFTSEESMDL